MTGLELRAAPGGFLLDLKVSAGSARERLVGLHGGRLKVAVRAAPERGKANRSVLRLLSRALEAPRGAVEIRAGAASPWKTVLIRGVPEATIRERIDRALGKEER